MIPKGTISFSTFPSRKGLVLLAKWMRILIRHFGYLYTTLGCYRVNVGECDDDHFDLMLMIFGKTYDYVEC